MATTKACRECCEPINVKAKRCPHCQAKQRTGGTAAKIALGFVALVVLAGLFTPDTISTKRDEVATGSEPMEAPIERNGVFFADKGGAYDGYCSPASQKIVEGLAKLHADAGGGTKLVIANGGEALLFMISAEQERDNLVGMFLLGEEPAWRKAVQGMYNSCVRTVYVVDPEKPVSEAVGVELAELSYVTK